MAPADPNRAKSRKRARSRTKTGTARLRTRRVAGELIAKVLEEDIGYLHVPQSLIDAAGDNSESGREVVIAPHWDGVAEMIGQTGGVYSAALRLLGRLDREVEALEARISEEVNLELDGRIVLSVIDGEVDGADVSFPDATGTQSGTGHAPDVTLRDSLGWASETMALPAPLWCWTAVPVRGQFGLDQYRLGLAEGALGTGGRTLPDEISLFDAERTWTEVRATVALATGNARVMSEPTRAEEIVSFRQRVVSAVVREFELRGFVDYFEASARPGRSSLQAGDVEAATHAHNLIRSLPDSYTSRTKVIKQIMQETGSDDRSVRNALARVGAYRAKLGGGRGHTNARDSRAEFEHFKRVVAQVAQNASFEGDGVKQEG